MLGNSRMQSPVGGAGEPLLAMKYVANDDMVNIGEARRHQRHGQDFSARSAHRDHHRYQARAILLRPFAFVPRANLERLEEVIVLLTLQPLQLNQDPQQSRQAIDKRPWSPTSSRGNGQVAANRELPRSLLQHHRAPRREDRQLKNLQRSGGKTRMNDAFDIRDNGIAHRGAQVPRRSHRRRHPSRPDVSGFVPVYFAKSAMIDLPLLITIYFGLSRRNPSTGFFLA